MYAVDFVKNLVEEFKNHDMSPIVVYGENSLPVIQFEGANESDCSLSVTVSASGIILRRVVGTNTVEQTFRFKDIDESFFDLIRDHYSTIKSLIKMRDDWLGKT